MASHRIEPKTIVVYVGLDRVGDALLKLPFVRGLRQAFPGAHVTWLAGKDTSVYASQMAPAVQGLIDEVIERANIGLDPMELLHRPLAGRRFDLVIDTQRVALASLALMRIPARWRLSPFANFLFSSVKPPKGYRFPKTMLRQMLDLLELATGQAQPTPQRIEVDIPQEMQEEARRLLPDGPRYAGLAPGAGGKPKCWPLERFAEVGKELASRGIQPVFLLGPQEPEWQECLGQAVPEALFPLQAPGVAERFAYSPLLTIALGGRLAASLANDSGVGHMLALSGSPLVSLFGPTSPAKFAPVSSRLSIVKAQDFGGREMSFIPTEAALAALQAALG
ncbi:MAG: lipopolysaccharide heptosyltransferase family protein [Rhodospirillales bacterium]|nr:MAG: lipopolysaccharide heptosyltransferase family protein [Rhodospirillales bacterium]